jgi:hypothetical protein
MMSALKFERQNGHTPTVSLWRSTGLFRAETGCECGGARVKLSSDWHRTESKALEDLRDKVLSEHGRVAMARAGWKCEECGEVRPLSAHHRVFRSHDRNDRVENLKPTCRPDHEREHGPKGKSNIRPADILEAE